MRKTIALIALMAIWLSACGPRPAGVTEPTPTGDAIATQVARLLTEMPTFTPAPILAPSATLAPINTQPAATETPTTTVTATVAATVASTPTAATGDPKSSLGEAAWKTSFDSGKPFGTVENDNTRIRMDNGALVLTGVTANGWLGWSMTFSQQPKDFYLDATFITENCAGDDQYGLMFRAPNTSAAYFFGLTCAGQYFLESNDFNDNGTQAVLIANSPSPSFGAGANQTNRLGVMAKGDKISLYANGVLLQEVTDNSFPEKGYFGAFVAAYNTASFTVRMEEISLWNLP